MPWPTHRTARPWPSDTTRGSNSLSRHPDSYAKSGRRLITRSVDDWLSPRTARCSLAQTSWLSKSGKRHQAKSSGRLKSAPPRAERSRHLARRPDNGVGRDGGRSSASRSLDSSALESAADPMVVGSGSGRSARAESLGSSSLAGWPMTSRFLPMAGRWPRQAVRWRQALESLRTTREKEDPGLSILCPDLFAGRPNSGHREWKR